MRRINLRRLLQDTRSRSGYAITNSNGREAYEHRVIAEEILERPLKYPEVVHHINFQKKDNRPENLCVLSRWNHERYHEWHEWIHKTYGVYPRRETQLRKLREDLKGILLGDL